MTKKSEIEKAIEGLKGLQKLLVPFFKKVNFEGQGESDAIEFKEHLRMAIEALGKQVPKKLVEDTVMDEEFWSQMPFERKIETCSTCKNIYIRNKQIYCDKCGQRLDWSGSDE